MEVAQKISIMKKFMAIITFTIVIVLSAKPMKMHFGRYERNMCLAYCYCINDNCGIIDDMSDSAIKCIGGFASFIKVSQELQEMR